MHIERCPVGKPRAFIICTVYHIRAHEIRTVASLSSPALRPLHLPFPTLRPSSLPLPLFLFRSLPLVHRPSSQSPLAFSLFLPFSLPLPALRPPSLPLFPLLSLSISLPFSLSFPSLRQHQGDGGGGDMGGCRKKWVQGSWRWVGGGVGQRLPARRGRDKEGEAEGYFRHVLVFFKKVGVFRKNGE
ncbi:hypothetical protein AAC387_Pa01g2770 [Persea americana]